tara:strand:- start:265 stop:888 length:624 start_codon:yes stop_codon:yes gene_type:complete
MSSSSVPDYWDQAKQDLSSDLVLSRLFSKFDGSILSSDGNLFRALVVSIVGQQISVIAARAVRERLESLVGEMSPESILARSHEELRSCGLSGMKSEYISGLARAWTEGYQDIDWGSLTDEQAKIMLTDLRGVGVWTAEMVLIFALLRPDVLPLTDIGLIRAMEKQYSDGREMSTEQIEAISDNWAPWRTVATWYLWRSIDPEPVQY